MKNLLLALSIISIIFSASSVFSQNITIETFNQVEPAQGEYDGRVPVKSFEVNGGVKHVVYFK